MTAPDHEELAVVRTTATAFEAHALAVVLEDAGIEALVLESDALGFAHDPTMPAGGAQLRVREEDQARAVVILDENASASTNVRWEDVDVGPRADELPLTPAGGMPLAARIAFAVAVVIVIATVAAGIIAIIL
jgi:hypothetical protein